MKLLRQNRCTMKSLLSLSALSVLQCSAMFFQKEVHPEAHIQMALLETSAELQQMMGGSAADPAGDLLGSIATMITQEMMPGIISAHNSTQHELDGFLQAVGVCPSPTMSSQPVTFLQTQSSTAGIRHSPVDGGVYLIESNGCRGLYMRARGAEAVLDSLPGSKYEPDFYWKARRNYSASNQYTFCSISNNPPNCLQSLGGGTPSYAFTTAARPNSLQWTIVQDPSLEGGWRPSDNWVMRNKNYQNWVNMYLPKADGCKAGVTKGAFTYAVPSYRAGKFWKFSVAPTTTTTTTTVLGGPAWISDKMGALLACRQREAQAANEDQACQEDLKTLEGVKNSSCNGLKLLEGKPMPEDLCNPTDPYEEWLNMANKKADDLKDELAKGKAGCGNATQLYDDKVPKCAGTKGQVDGNKTECDRLQAEAEIGICSGPLAAQQEACDDYGECYDNAIAAYQEKEPTIKKLHRNWTVQWRVLKRMDCLLGVMSTGGTNDDVDQCKEKLWPTDHLDLVYPVFPEKETCPGAGAVFLQTEMTEKQQSKSSSEGLPLPCGDDFLRKHYGNNPEGAPAATCTPCTTTTLATIAATTATTTVAPHFEPQYGGQGGGDFSDWASGMRGDIESFCAWSGGYIDAIQVTYRGIGQGHRHGGDGGGHKCIHLAVGERITKMHIAYGGYVDSIGVTTSNGKTARWGGEGGTVVNIVPNGKHLVSIYGKGSGYLDALGTVWQ